MKKIVLKNLNKYYYRHQSREIHVINNTSFELENTGLVCLLGESGSGKTTLLNTIGGIDKADSGEIRVDGKLFNYKSRKGEGIRCNKFAYVFQNYYLITSMTVYENLMLALEPYHLSKTEANERIDYVLDKVGMFHFKKRNIKNLSGGQIQRVAIARALVKTPDVIFADEPTGNLDEKTTIEVMMILKKISKSCLVVMATHERKIAEFFADRIINIEEGKVISDTKISSQNRVYDDFDDNNIYLKEYQEDNYSFKDNKLTLYSKENSNLDIKVIYDHNKYYISGENIELLDQKSSIKIIDDKKPIRTLSDVDSFEYDLKKASKINNGKLSFPNFFSKLISSSKKKGFKIMIITMLLISVLFVLGVGDYQTLSKDKTSELVSSDSRCVNVSFSDGASNETAEKKEYIQEFINLYREEMGNDILVRNSISGNLKYNGFLQIENMKNMTETVFSNFSYMPLEYLNQNSIIYGRMPEEASEAVVDRWVLEKYMKENSISFQSLTNIKDYLGLEFYASRKKVNLKIVGICESNNMSVYVDKFMIISAAAGSSTSTYSSLDTLKQYYPDEYKDVTLADDQLIVKNDDPYKDFSTVKVCNFAISFNRYPLNVSDEFPYDYVITDKGYQTITDYLICINEKMTIITDDYEKVKDYVKMVLSSDEAKYQNIKRLQIEVTSNAFDTMESYNKENNKKILSRSIILASIFAVCLISLFITMKAHANENMENMMVYRLLGIRRQVVLALSAAEILFMSLIVMIPSSLLLIYIFKFVTMLPGVSFEFIFTPLAYVISLSIILLINTLVGILPVALILRRTPAELVSKYDI